MKVHGLAALFCVALLSWLSLSGCQSAYYGTMEKFGVHKRDIMVDRVEEARDSQKEAKEQFADALERFGAVVKFGGGSLERKYKELSDEFEASEKQAREVSDRIDAVEEVAEALFDEWEQEIAQYSNETYRRESERDLDRTRGHYKKLISAMQKAESRMAPVLDAFRDQVLFLKHKLNTQAIASLQSEYVRIESSVASLIQEMEKAIREADAFIESMPAS